MTSSRPASREQPPLSVPMQSPGSVALLPDISPISALFLIEFDVKAGYKIVWKQALPDLELEAVVEYKSLPSGLHTVEEDLVYFVHNAGHAGLSAFVNMRTEEEGLRNARMIAVGVLVPLTYGRLGRAWRHAGRLKDMAKTLAADRNKTAVLGEYWSEHRVQEGIVARAATEPLLASKPSLDNNHSRKRSISDGAALPPPGHKLSPLHPAWSLTSLLDTFGPLIFPIYRAALLRKRILISARAPVHEVCNYVYDISVLSNIPSSVHDVLDFSAPTQRLRPLFNIGVHDIPYLMEQQQQQEATNWRSMDDRNEATSKDDAGWVACTTDSIFSMKDELWDVLITLPPPYSNMAKEKVWPTLESRNGVPIKATQRDLRRFRTLKQSLFRLANLSQSMQNGRHANSSERPSTTPETRRPSRTFDGDADKVVEPTTWAALAYSGFMWWASAGEQRRGEESEEQAHNAALLADLMPSAPCPRRRSSLATAAYSNVGGAGGRTDLMTCLSSARVGSEDHGSGTFDSDSSEDERARMELTIIAYFHRWTNSILRVLAEKVDGSDEDDILDVGVGTANPDENDDTALLGQEADWIGLDSDALARMGLDVWSQSDADFVSELAARYFARRAHVELKGLEVCGLRVC